MRIELYEEVTGKKAGQVFDDTENIDHDNGRQTSKRPLGHRSTYHPFQSATDFAAASVVSQSEMYERRYRKILWR
jgi:hypothetical protein